MECPHILEVEYEEFGRRLQEKAKAKRIPILGSMEVTARCNLNCVHCYINLPAGDRQAKENELSYDEFCQIIDQIVDEGCLWLLLTGGEPLVRPDFLDIYTYAKKKGLIVTIFTNGTLITQRIADFLAEWRPASVGITLYGRTKETYERVTRVPRSYERCMRGVDLLLQHRIPVRLKTVAMTLNYHELWDMQAYAEDLGLQFRFDAMIHGRLDGSKQALCVRLSPQEVVDLDLSDAKRRKALQEACQRPWAPPADPERLYYCGAGLFAFHVDPYGQLSVCIISRHSQYALRQGGFAEGWRDPLRHVHMQRRSREVGCRTCVLHRMCSQCPAQSQLEHGDDETPVEFICEVTHLRATTFMNNH